MRIKRETPLFLYQTLYCKYESCCRFWIVRRCYFPSLFYSSITLSNKKKHVLSTSLLRRPKPEEWVKNVINTTSINRFHLSVWHRNFSVGTWSSVNHVEHTLRIAVQPTLGRTKIKWHSLTWRNNLRKRSDETLSFVTPKKPTRTIRIFFTIKNQRISIQKKNEKVSFLLLSLLLFCYITPQRLIVTLTKQNKRLYESFTTYTLSKVDFTLV